MLHQKIDGIASLSTGKTMTNLLRGRHHERRGLVIVERTQSLIVNTRLAEVNELTHHIHNIGGIHNLIDGRPVNHWCKDSTNLRIFSNKDS